jgi:hypothetical protein
LPVLVDGRCDFAIMLFVDPYLLFACRERMRSLTKPISANHILAIHIRTDHIIAA